MKLSTVNCGLRELLALVSIISIFSAFSVSVNAAPVSEPVKVQEFAPTSLPVKPLSQSEQERFLATRMPGAMFGSFGSFASLLFPVADIIIGSDDDEVRKAQLHSLYPAKEIYMPTRAEFFEMIGLQTGSTFSYQSKNNVWLFQKASLPLPYSIEKAPGWSEENRDGYVSYKPSIAPVGMDIYTMGRYSGLSNEKEKQIREFGATMFSMHVSPKTTVADMKPATVDGVDALYFASDAPAKDRLWRQWSFLKAGELYVIVSSYSKDQKEQIERDVDTMVKSFHGKSVPDHQGK